jgi:DNA-binding HxlR family transcriptional regulator
VTPIARVVLEKIAARPRWVGELRRSFPSGHRMTPKAMRTILRGLLHKGYVKRESGRFYVTGVGERRLIEVE